MDDEQVLSGVGPRLKALRQRNGATLATLSRATGISISTLSRLESGARKPSLELLLPLARAHRVALDELVGAPQTGDPRVHQQPIVREGRTYIPLTRQPGGLQAFKTIFHDQRAPDPRTHEGYEWLYVLSGRVRLVLGDQDLVLRRGEAVEFDTRVPHWVGNASSGSAEILNLFGPQGERVHVKPRGRRVITP
ncbi:hypothetical protein Lesp02_12040 [Lentzea sp. NBRC 105346]|uniref:helix-turn-helix domain-containing protein n=1 Tax=Lentzea sp. NBRC 105346 TaxID=3032205 RepID=UPI0024A3840A|nr:XRE family transcriptional regulator [Lentzea sp. NBRC 105346]GLZ29014.1 hypothetical protein Lesp02_12040 [Lentzea sp. NBRC 105346]